MAFAVPDPIALPVEPRKRHQQNIRPQLLCFWSRCHCAKTGIFHCTSPVQLPEYQMRLCDNRQTQRMAVLTKTVEQRTRIDLVPDRPKTCNDCPSGDREIRNVIGERQAFLDPQNLGHGLAACQSFFAEPMFFVCE